MGTGAIGDSGDEVEVEVEVCTCVCFRPMERVAARFDGAA